VVWRLIKLGVVVVVAIAVVQSIPDLKRYLAMRKM